MLQVCNVNKEYKEEKRLYLYRESTIIAKLVITKESTIKEILSTADSLVGNSNIYNKYLRIDNKLYITPTNLVKYQDTQIFDIIKDDGINRQGGLQYILRNTKTKTQCLKANELRKAGYENIKDWLEDPNHVYVSWRATIYISDNGDKEPIKLEKNKWTTPYKVELGMTLEESLYLYRLYLVENDRIQYLDELKGKTLGCFCKQSINGIACHAQILAELCNK